VPKAKNLVGTAVIFGQMLLERPPETEHNEAIKKFEVQIVRWILGHF